MPVYEKAMKLLKDCNNLPEGIIDIRYASEYACYACIFTENGDPAMGERYYQKYLQTGYASTPEGEAIRIEYLLSAKRYQEALPYIRKNKEFIINSQEDTVSLDYIKCVLEPEARACENIGDKQGAIRAYRQMIVLTDSLNAREKKNAALELATIYEMILLKDTHSEKGAR